MRALWKFRFQLQPYELKLTYFSEHNWVSLPDLAASKISKLQQAPSFLRHSVDLLFMPGPWLAVLGFPAVPALWWVSILFAENCSFAVPGPRTAQLDIKAGFVQWSWPKNRYISFEVLLGLFKPVLLRALFLSILKGEMGQERQVDAKCHSVSQWQRP